MRQTVAKYLRREAVHEMRQGPSAERELVTTSTTAVNHPRSVRAMYRALKRAYKNLRRVTAQNKHFVVK